MPPTPEPAAPGGPPSRAERAFWPALALILVAGAVAYAPTLGHGLTNWDDDGYVRTNPWLGQHSWAAVASMFSTPYKANYHPLTMLSLWLDHAVSGGRVAMHHGVNLLLHLLATGLATLLIRRLGAGVGVALAAGALFALHPIHVESVAWVSERKDVLYACFALAALLVYARAVGTGRPTGRRLLGLAAAFALFVAALLSKGVAVSVAPTLVLIDWLLGRRWASPGVLLEKLPFFAVAILSGLVTLAAQGAAGQLVGESQWSGLERIALAGTAFARYLALTAVPLGLSAFHPYPDRVDGALPLVYWLGPVVFLAYQGLTLWLMRRARLAAFGLAFFTIHVFLLLQWIPVGGALIAERYAYLGALGLFVAVADASVRLVERAPAWRVPVATAAAVYLVLLGAGTFARTGVWANSLTLWDDVLARSPGVPVARLNRALARHEAGDLTGALADLDAALEADPRYARALGHRGVMRYQTGDTEGALADLDRSLVVEPTLETTLNRGAIRLAIGDHRGALADLDRVLAADPTQPLAWANRGLAQLAAGRPAPAIGDFDRALALAPDYLPARLGRAEARLALGTSDRALAEAEAILQGAPGLPEAEWVRGRALLDRGADAAGCAALDRAAAAGHGDAADHRARHCPAD